MSPHSTSDAWLPATPWLADTPWPVEDGGPSRPQRPNGLAGPAAGSARLAAVRHEPVCVMAVLAPDDRVLLLRNTVGADAVSWVEDVDPEHLGVRRRSPDLPLGPFWPGGLGVLADGAVIVVQGRWVHRLSPELDVERSRRLPVDAPYNSFVVMGDGSLAMKDLQRPDGAPSTLLLLDPITLEQRAEPLVLPEPCVARLTADGDDVLVVGVSALHRVRWDPARGHAYVLSDRSTTYVDDQHSYGWDPVATPGATWFMDNGEHTFERGLTMLGNGVAPGAVRLWRVPDDGTEPVSVEVSGRPNGAITNPPVLDPVRGLVMAYDSANGVLAGFDADDLSRRWTVEIATAQHLVSYPDTGELLVNDHDRATGDSLVVIDVDDGSERARVHVGSPAQSVVFCTPGRRRDAYYVSLSTVARVAFDD